MCMATKTISITESAYRRLLALKGANESFSIVIEKITEGSALSNIQGILSGSQATQLQKVINQNNKKDNTMRNAKLKGICQKLR